MRVGLISAWLGLLALVGLAAYVRFAPSDRMQWHIDLEKDRPAAMDIAPAPAGADLVRPLLGGAYADIPASPAIARDLLTKLDAIAMATPRTTRLAGTVAEGRITWITRSALWGFPDYSTAQITTRGLTVYSRLRFGKSDMGVNAVRLKDWLARL